MSAQGYATVADFSSWQAQAKQMTAAQLHWTIEDCRKAMYAMSGWNPVREGYYKDQMLTYADEARRRRSV